MVIHIITKFFIVRGNFRKSALMILTFTFSFWSLISEISSITNHMMGNFFEMLYINVKIFCNYFIYCNITLISLYCNNLLVIYTYLFLIYPVLERFSLVPDLPVCIRKDVKAVYDFDMISTQVYCIGCFIIGWF